MKTNKAWKIRIYPNKEQTQKINQNLGCARALYNMMLHERIEVYKKLKEDKETLYSYKYKTEKEYKNSEGLEWLKEVDSLSLIYSTKHLKTAFQNFFSSLKGKRKGRSVGFPKYKKKKLECSYSTYGSSLQIDTKLQKVRLPKIGWINFRDKKEFIEGNLKSATISRTPSGKYYASLLFEQEIDKEVELKKVTNPDKVIGLDMSLEKFYVDHNGKSPEYVKFVRKYSKQMKQANQSMSKKIIGSQNWYKARHRVAVLHEKIANSRKDFNRKLSTYLVNTYDVICIETLSLRGMSSKKGFKLGKSIMDLGWHDFTTLLKQKAKEKGVHIIEASRWFASSKLCSHCNHKNSGLQLNERTWICMDCNTKHNRDENAGRNLRKLGLDQFNLVENIGGLTPDFKPVEKQASGGDSFELPLSYTSVKQEKQQSCSS